MNNILQALGARIDCCGGDRRMRRFRGGKPSIGPAGVQFFRTSKVQYRYLEQGEGLTIVFAADPPMTLEMYEPLIKVFSSRFRVVVVEMPAMGFSATTSNFSFGFRETNDDLSAFLEQVAGLGAILAFSCVAGLAAIDLAVRRPELVSRLALIQTGDVEAFSHWKSARDPNKILAKPILGQLIMKPLARKRMPEWYAISVGKREKIPEFIALAKETLADGALWSLASVYQTYMDPKLILTTPSQPLLSIWGEADRSHAANNIHSILRIAKEGSTVSFPDLGHTPELEDPERVFSVIEEFVFSGGGQREALLNRSRRL